MWRGLSEMVHTTGLEMDGWGSSNSWRMGRPVAGAPAWGFWGRAGQNHAGSPDVSGEIKPILYQEQGGFFKYRCYVGGTVKTS